MKHFKLLAATSFAALMAAPAFAACSNPTDIDPNDMVFQMKPNAAGETYIGIAANAPDLTSMGTVYYSMDELDMVACDGSDWVALGGSGNGGPANSGTKVMVDTGSFPVKALINQYAVNDQVIPGHHDERAYKIKYTAYNRGDSHAIACILSYLDGATEYPWSETSATFNQCSGSGDSRTCSKAGGIGYMEFEIEPVGGGVYNWGPNDQGQVGQMTFDGRFRISTRNSQYTYAKPNETYYVPDGVYVSGDYRYANCEGTIEYEAYEYQ